jgi:Ca2+-binding RTX toxin-like protein
MGASIMTNFSFGSFLSNKGSSSSWGCNLDQWFGGNGFGGKKDDDWGWGGLKFCRDNDRDNDRGWSSDNDDCWGFSCKDQTLGVGAPKYQLKSVDFTVASVWSGLPAHSTTLDLSGLTLSSINGELYNFLGASVLSVGDALPGQSWTKEVDAYNDAPEGLHLDFDAAQTSVTLTLNQIYAEQLYTKAFTPEKALVTVSFTDGTSTTLTVQGVQTAQPGELAINLKSSDFGGKYIASVDLAPSLDLAPDVPASASGQYNATHPYSEFTLKSVAYRSDCAVDSGKDDVLCGGRCDDKLYGGAGSDRLYGGKGADTLFGGSGDNFLIGGKGSDTFVFGFTSKGDDIVADFDLKRDHIRLDDGITVLSTAQVSGNTVLHLSNGGDVTLLGIANVSDWHSLL